MNTLRLFSARRYLSRTVLSCAALTLLAGAASAQSRSVAETNAPAARPVARLVTVLGGSRASVSAITPRARAINASTAINPYAASSGSGASAPIVAEDEQRIFELINQERYAQGLPPLALDGELCRLARLHSSDMATGNFLNHTNREGLDAAGRVRAAGVRGWRAVGENIALNQGYADPASFAVERWMKSEKHRANITSGMWTHTGLGIARAADGTFYFTQVFMMR